MYRTSLMNHRNTRNPHMVAEREVRTTTQKPASPDNSTVEPLAQVMVAAEQIPTPVSNNSKVLKICWRMPRWPRGSHPRHTGERRGERRSHRNHSRSVSRINTSQELQRRRNSTRLPDLKRSPQTRTTRPSDTKPCHTSVLNS